MKKIILLVILSFIGIQLSTAQNLDDIMSQLEKMEGSSRQFVDRKTLNEAINKSSANEDEKVPSFIHKIDSIEVITLEDNEDARTFLIDQLAKIQNDEIYETLVKVNDEEDNVHIIAQRSNKEIIAVYILVADEEDVVAVKMSGMLDKEDLEEIIKEQTKKNR